ncbi:MAG: hypothetical protein QXK25_07240 [Ignisphaera sp.]
MFRDPYLFILVNVDQVAVFPRIIGKERFIELYPSSTAHQFIESELSKPLAIYTSLGNRFSESIEVFPIV